MQAKSADVAFPKKICNQKNFLRSQKTEQPDREYCTSLEN